MVAMTKYQKNIRTRIESSLPKTGKISIKEIADKVNISFYTVWWHINRMKNVVKIRIGKKKHEYYIKKMTYKVFQQLYKRLRYCAMYMWTKFKNDIALVHQYNQETSKQLFSLARGVKLAT